MREDHTRIEELLAVRALGALDPDEERELDRAMAEHGSGCPECRRLRAGSLELDDIAGRLAFALDPVAVRDGLEDDVVAVALAGPPAPRPVAAPAREGRGGPLRALAAIAAALVLLVAGWGVGVLTSDDDPALLEGARVIAFEGEGQGGAGATLALAYLPGERGIYLVGSGLDPRPQGGDVYELWTFEGETPVRGGCFRPRADGSVFEFLDAEIVPTPLMAITVEAASCPDAPTTTPILLAQRAV